MIFSENRYPLFGIMLLSHPLGDALIDVDGNAVNVGTGVGHEEGDEAADVGRWAEAVDAEGARQFGARSGAVELALARESLDAAVEAVGLDVARMDGVDPDAVAVADGGEGLGEMLERRVDRAA